MPTLLLATMYLRMAAPLEPFLFLSAVMTMAIMKLYLGWSAGLVTFLAFVALGAAAEDMVVVGYSGGNTFLGSGGDGGLPLD